MAATVFASVLPEPVRLGQFKRCLTAEACGIPIQGPDAVGGRREERHSALLQQLHAQSSGYGLGWSVVGEDAREDPVQVQFLECVPNGRGTGLRGVAPPPVIGVERPADLHARPVRTLGTVEACPAQKDSRGPLLQRPLSGSPEHPLAQESSDLLPGVAPVQALREVQPASHLRAVQHGEVVVHVVILERA